MPKYAFAALVTPGSISTVSSVTSGMKRPREVVSEPPPSLLQSLPLMPEWYFVLAALGGLCALGSAWHPLLWILPLLLTALGASLAQALLAVRGAYRNLPRIRGGGIQLRMITAFLHLLQPLARLVGRIRHGLTPWRPRDVRLSHIPRKHQSAALLSGAYESPQEKLTALERALRRAGAVVRRGGEYARWDLELQGGLLGSARLLLSVEDLCPGKQLVRFRSWPALGRWGLALFAVRVALALGAVADRAWLVAGVLGLAGSAVMLRSVREAAYSQSTLLQLLQAPEQRWEDFSTAAPQTDAE